MQEEHLSEAIVEAIRGVESGAGGPFGAVIVRAGDVIGRGHNRVLVSADPTAHAEIVAIRDACARLGHHSLAGAVLYASCEPCPMCWGASAWARIDRIYYAATRDEAAAVGFDDARLHAQLEKPGSERAMPLVHLQHPDARGPFDAWQRCTNKVLY
ncbi:MAG: nucleoside deaminase [Myxococcales bacterium]|nr:nucleoside deaminase [Myxococcales bacterium]MDD9969750.1 nucleoside deaminase [Myxococcales bacterium]